MTDKLMICKKCGNNDKFFRRAYGSVAYIEFNKHNNKGDFLDTIDTEYGDYNTTDYEAFQCNDCESEDILTLTIHEYIEFISFHTLPDGEWTEEALPIFNMKVKLELQAKLMLGD